MAITPFGDFFLTPREELVHEVASLLHDLLVSDQKLHVVQAAEKIMDLVDERQVRPEFDPSDYV